MKKLLLVLGMITCLFGLAACGTTEVVEESVITEDMAAQYAEGLISSMYEIVLTGQEEQYKSDEVITRALDNFKTALEDLGDYQSALGTTVDFGDEIIINTTIAGSLRDANVEIILDGENLVPISIATNVIYSFGELMTKAALNTLMGMGTVFAVLILIIIIISSFSLINKAGTKDESKKVETKPVPAVINEEVIHEEDLSDDLELVAVIAAAIAAYEGKSSADGYVVRSLKRRR